GSIRGQLATQEKRKNRHKKGRLVGDGLPRLLTSRAFVRRVIKFEEAATAKAAALKERKATRAEKAEILNTWKALDADRKKQNDEIQSNWQADVVLWKAESVLAKSEHRRAGCKKPTLKKFISTPSKAESRCRGWGEYSRGVQLRWPFV
ncbi:hypothetical protein B0H10DRAFT_1809855, partial [Mycena sp. CBHHK59/15]